MNGCAASETTAEMIIALISDQALMRHPDVNVQYSDDALLAFPSADVGIAVAAPYEVPPGAVPTAGPLAVPTVPGGTVWFCLTRSSRPISANAGRHKEVKWYLASTSCWLTPFAASTVGRAIGVGTC